MGIYLGWIQLLFFSTYIASSYSGLFGFNHRDSSKAPFSRCKADAREPWSYRGKNGPHHWGERYPTCDGGQQSPISINSQNVIFDDTLEKLYMKNYDVPITQGTIENNGHTIEVSATDGVQRGIFIDGEAYRLTQFHFHWGDAYYKGAEHMVDGKMHSMEMHLVHQNSRNEIAVVGVFFQEQSKESRELQNIIDHLPEVLYKDLRTELKTEIVLNHLVPSNPSSFYRYTGSLTTPACTEGVTWSLLAQPLPVGLNQMVQFRKLYSATKSEASKKCKLYNNYRPIQPLNGRKVFGSQ